eukprot:5705502-Amphidinium_carterae.1
MDHSRSLTEPRSSQKPNVCGRLGNYLRRFVRDMLSTQVGELRTDWSRVAATCLAKKFDSGSSLKLPLLFRSLGAPRPLPGASGWGWAQVHW